ncbi:putative PEP-binding protein, partial [Streptosporangium sp. NPDC001682]
QAALLQLIADCAAAGQAVGKPVGVCGEAAADPLLATVLVGLGVTSLSMSAPSVPAVRESLAAHSLAQCRDNARFALGADDPGQARKMIVPGW